jgi:soluble lytic murein transglycosylase-like protein
MAALARLLASVLIVACFAEAAHGQTAAIDRWEGLIGEAARKFNLPEAWIRSVMRVESGGNTILQGRQITSPAGAMGLMQIMPSTWGYLRGRYGLGPDPYDPHDNIFAGAAFLRELYLQYGYPNMFAAYSAGPSRVDSFMAGASNLPAETRSYLSRLAGLKAAGPGEAPLPAPVRLFFGLGQRPAVVPRSNPGGLFVPLRGR